MFRRLFTAMVGLALLGGLTVAEAGGELELRVKVDFLSQDVAVGGLGGGAFYIPGVICEDPDLLDPCVSTIGTFHCWGWIIGNVNDPNAPAVVAQEWDLDGCGKIQVQGLEDEGPRAVTGGTGDFRNARGEATEFDFSKFLSDGEFTGTFKLIGAKGK